MSPEDRCLEQQRQDRLAEQRRLDRQREDRLFEARRLERMRQQKLEDERAWQHNQDTLRFSTNVLTETMATGIRNSGNCIGYPNPHRERPPEQGFSSIESTYPVEERWQLNIFFPFIRLEISIQSNGDFSGWMYANDGYINVCGSVKSQPGIIFLTARSAVQPLLCWEFGFRVVGGTPLSVNCLTFNGLQALWTRLDQQ